MAQASAFVLLFAFVLDTVLAVGFRAFVLPNNPLLLLFLLAGGLLRLRYDHVLLSLVLVGAFFLVAVVIPWGLASYLVIHDNLRSHGTWGFAVHIGINMALLGGFVALEATAPRGKPRR